jgi:predicted outer membrane repeat protein
MLTFPMHIRTSWDDYFTGSPTKMQSNEYEIRQNPSNSSLHVSNCLFRSIKSTSKGGALSCTSVTYLLVESSSFFSCNTSATDGGAIYFYNGNGQCVLYGVCGYDCCSTYTGSNSLGQFILASVSNGASSKNYVNYSSISRCVNGNTHSYQTLRLLCGKIYLPSVNLSMNKCYHRSGMYCSPSSDSVTCSLTYSSLTDNHAIGYTCINFGSEQVTFEMKSCNILRNTQGDLNIWGTIYTHGYLTIENSCILENTATYIFYQTSSSRTITLSNSTVDSTSNNGYLTIQNTVTKSFILALNHMSTQNCHSGYDSAGTLTPIIQTPSSSLNKQKLYNTCQRLFYHPPQANFISLTSLFIYHFIHPYASVDSLY